MQVFFARSWRELVNSVAHAWGCLIIERKCTFLTRSWASCPRDLCNLWVKQLTTAQICTNFGLRSSVGENCAIFIVNVDCQNCAILEPCRLPIRIVQFMEGRLVSLQNCTIHGGKVGFPLELHNFLGFAQPAAGPSLGDQLVRGMHQVVIDRLPFCKQNTESCELYEARQAVVKSW